MGSIRPHLPIPCMPCPGPCPYPHRPPRQTCRTGSPTCLSAPDLWQCTKPQQQQQQQPAPRTSKQVCKEPPRNHCHYPRSVARRPTPAAIQPARLPAASLLICQLPPYLQPCSPVDTHDPASRRLSFLFLITCLHIRSPAPGPVNVARARATPPPAPLQIQILHKLMPYSALLFSALPVLVAHACPAYAP